MARSFPAGFLWGAATAAYQIEGAVREDGRGESIWDRFSHTPGNTYNGDTGDIACDHYHRWPEDVRLMRELGLNAYRLSIAWPRIYAGGTGPLNQAGLDWYDRLIDALVEAGIAPFVTLHHWDLPQALQERGGWASRETVDAFAEYAETVGRRLGDRVRGWITINEPQVLAWVGHYWGDHAPGIRDLRIALRVSQHLLLAHGRALQRLRSVDPDARVGITLNLSPATPATASPEDAAAADLFDQFQNRWFLDPLVGRDVPPDLRSVFADQFSPLAADQMREIAAPLDFLGINYYYPTLVRAGGEFGFKQLSVDELRARGYAITTMGWPVVPNGLYELLTRVHRDYQPRAMYVTENGAAFEDEPRNGSVPDPLRVAFLESHLDALSRAIEAGVPMRGYFVWSLMDNFEWARGYSQRFGITYINYTTQQRLIKDSGHWYRHVATSNSLPATNRSAA